MKNDNLKNEAILQLKKYIKPNTEIVVIQHSVSRSGMSRKLSAYVVSGDKLIDLNKYIARSGIFKLDKNQKIISKGCGMDMLFDLAYTLKSKLYGYEVAGKNQQYYSIY